MFFFIFIFYFFLIELIVCFLIYNICVYLYFFMQEIIYNQIYLKRKRKRKIYKMHSLIIKSKKKKKKEIIDQLKPKLK